MAVSVDRFLKHLGDSGILSSDDLLGLKSRIPEDRRDQDAQRLAQELVRQGKLTRFQANALYQGKPQGLTLGNYVLLDKIGAGGMGMVFKAEHRRMKRMVAVKVLSPAALKDPDTVKRFHREVEAVAKLSHPNIVAAHDADEFNGIHFLVMEYVEGSDLAQHVKKSGPLPVDKGLDFVTQAARGLEHAHQQGIIHRDIKPANLLLDRAGVVKILDMGLARMQEVASSAKTTAQVAALTQTGSLMGTIDFMSPEQAVDSRLADAISDVYSLGATLYFLLQGKALYEGETIMSRVLAHRESPIPSLAAGRSDVPPQIDAIFQRMVAKKKEARYPTMTALLHDLTHWREVAAAPRAAAESSIPQNVISAIFDDD
ncbi:MAG: serine/threonine protein kinase [Planctomycetales bacterium]